MAITNLGANLLLNRLITVGGYLALGTNVNAPDSSGVGFIETTYPGYQRVNITNKMGVSNKVLENTEAIFFPASTANPSETITYIALFDNLTNGNMYFWAPLTASIQIPRFYVPVFRSGNFSITLT